MSHITKLFFEGHPTCSLFEEAATFLGIDIHQWEFADGTENEHGGMEIVTVVYTPLNPKADAFTLYGVFITDDGEWQIQQFGTNQDYET